MPKSISLLLVEDNRLVSEALAALLSRQSDFDVLAVAQNAATALPQLRERKPGIVLIDAALGDHDSQRLVAEVTMAAPKSRVIVMDLLPDPDEVGAFIKAGAAGFIAKDATLDDLVTTIRSVAGGASVVPNALTGALFTHVARYAVTAGATDAADAVRMTQREREVFELVADGLSNKQIAQRLNVATNTVKGHVHNILEKLALHTRLEIAAFARKTTRPSREPD
jgi:two-component system, NarL family, nitrate/nitrite response regulator NarL